MAVREAGEAEAAAGQCPASHPYAINAGERCCETGYEAAASTGILHSYQQLSLNKAELRVNL